MQEILQTGVLGGGGTRASWLRGSCDTARVRSRRASIAVLAACAAVSGYGPMSALADSGPSAGDNQYVDPLAGTHSPGTGHHTQTGTSTTVTPSSGPTATASSDPATLPLTGDDAILVGVLGAGIAAAGAAVRRASRS